MTRTQMIEVLDKIREEIATDEFNELTEYACEKAYICIVEAIEQLKENAE